MKCNVAPKTQQSLIIKGKKQEPHSCKTTQITSRNKQHSTQGPVGLVPCWPISKWQPSLHHLSSTKPLALFCIDPTKGLLPLRGGWVRPTVHLHKKVWEEKKLKVACIMQLTWCQCSLLCTLMCYNLFILTAISTLHCIVEVSIQVITNNEMFYSLSMCLSCCMQDVRALDMYNTA